MEYRPKGLLNRLYRGFGTLALAGAVGLFSVGYAKAQPPPCEIEPPYDIWGLAEIDGLPVVDGRPTRVFVDANGDKRYVCDPDPLVSEEVTNMSDTPNTTGGYFDAIIGACDFTSTQTAMIAFNPVGVTGGCNHYTTMLRDTVLNNSNNTTNEDKVFSIKLRLFPAGTNKDTIEIDPIDEATLYDISRGNGSELAIIGGAVDLGILTCISDDAAGTVGTPIQATDSTLPADGQYFFYVARPASPLGHYGYGRDSTGIKTRTIFTGGCP